MKRKAVLTRHRVEIESTSFHFHIGPIFLEVPGKKKNVVIKSKRNIQIDYDDVTFELIF